MKKNYEICKQFILIRGKDLKDTKCCLSLWIKASYLLSLIKNEYKNYITF